ncbi:hypothetical protein M7I_1831 [Glarea lozoyensis 74030]|uniref:Uncharacterized protein n=1 Tax=Glarea lozoyensis (strain ATCC 74030 / MF5533) TaxID=1104152 RepID=H0EGX3_GLAL7|nr:hypothetical protein M7I_1831 [Glarea lozoyensis 74030]
MYETGISIGSVKNHVDKSIGWDGRVTHNESSGVESLAKTCADLW